MLLPFLPRPRPAAAATVTYITTLTDTVDASSFTFSGTSTGDAHSQRLIVLGVAVDDNGVPPTVTLTVTVDGNTAARQIGANSNKTAIYAVNIPSGTTADIVVSGSESMSRCVVSVWRVVPGISTTIVAADFADGSGGSGTISALGVRKNGVVVMFAYAPGSSATGFGASWSGSDTFTENVDAALEATARYAAYDAAITEAIIAGNMTLTGAAGGYSFLMASWR